MAPRPRNTHLNVVIAGDPKGAQKAMKTVGTEAKGLTGTLGKVATAATGLFVGAKVVQWGQSAIATYRSIGGEMLKLQRLTGATEEQVSGLWVAAQQSGVPIDKLATSIGIFSSKLQSGALDKLGLGLRDATGQALPLDDALRRVMDRVASMEGGSEKSALVRTLFGRGGADLLPLLNRGGAALDDFIARAKELGLTLNSEDVKQATKNQRDFQLATKAAGFVVGKELLPAVTGFTSFAARNLPPIVGFVTSITDAFNGLPGPVKAAVGLFLAIGPAVKVFSMVAAPIKASITALTGFASAAQTAAMNAIVSKQAIEGLGSAGTGAASQVGGLTSGVGALGVAGPIAAAGVGVLIAAFVQAQIDADQAKRNVQALREAIEGGASPMEAAAERLAATLSGVEGGFEGIKGSSQDMRENLENAGISTEELAAGLAGDADEFQALIDKINAAELAPTFSEDEGRTITAIENLKDWREQTQKAVTQEKDHKAALKELGIETDDTGAAFEDAASSAEKFKTSLERANEAVERMRQRQESVRSAEQNVAQAHETSTEAQEELAEARRAAAGDSEEYADAQQAVRDAEQGVVDAQAEVVDAQREVLDAQQALNDARAEAKDRLVEMAQAARDAALAEADANLKAREARQELERTQADPRATALEKERAALEVKMAEEAARQAAEDNQMAQRDNADAQARGVEGDQGVVDARNQVREANDRVTDAERRLADARRAVGEANRASAQVITDAQARVEEASRKVDDALLDEAKAWGDLAEAQNGPLEGARAYRRVLQDLVADLDPNSPLAQRVGALLRDLNVAINLGNALNTGPKPASGKPGEPGFTGTTGYFPEGPAMGPPSPNGQVPVIKPRKSLQPAEGSSITIVNNNQGTPTQQRRAMVASTESTLDKVFRGAR